ncbi:uncharacterized protein LOC108665020 isoform X2 [Hyalella azteca]|uniref:Uncharacterized protein LOC108665020 isoform X2 n=1 Tax=Hyalella azteca TaxID=294128 RepID=A0A8B7N061_HYAAZ|nr:uncharacterized protein LOC108665020 isoform X2 [Hyalella azteca]
MAAFIAVHVGAGDHSRSNHPIYKSWMRKACRKGQLILQGGGSAVDAVSAAIQVLEACELTNTGYGSALTNRGTVECDAGIMESSGLRHGAVGAVSGIQHPICVAHKLLTLQSKPLLGNLVPPALLVGSGAVEWAAANGIDTCEESKLVSAKSLERHRYYLRQLRKLKHKQRREKLALKSACLHSTRLAANCNIITFEETTETQRKSSSFKNESALNGDPTTRETTASEDDMEVIDARAPEETLQLEQGDSSLICPHEANSMENLVESFHKCSPSVFVSSSQVGISRIPVAHSSRMTHEDICRYTSAKRIRHDSSETEIKEGNTKRTRTVYSARKLISESQSNNSDNATGIYESSANWKLPNVGPSLRRKRTHVGATTEATSNAGLLSDDVPTGSKPLQTVLDTVGCVAVSADGTVAAGASSGGILLKTPGRVGQSAVLGAGYWAENDCKGSGRNIAVCTSGCGEMLVSSHLAMNAAAAVASTADDSKFLKSYSRPKSSGCLILKHNPAEGYTDLYCCHSSISFGFAYMGAEDENPKAVFSSMDAEQEGQDMLMNCFSYFPRSSVERDATPPGASALPTWRVVTPVDAEQTLVS